ncbi:MAG: arginine--tRNA ligase [Desulfobulbus propionicus]|nr:MAG: arginine--tRNA ligase [Desulfobulbus propionicus]
MIRKKIKKILDQAFDLGVARQYWSGKARDKYAVEVPRHEGQGDFSTNLALVVAGMEKGKPRDIAGHLKELLEEDQSQEVRVEIAGPGFVNFFLDPGVWTTVLDPVYAQGDAFGRSQANAGVKALVEFVSANPTGPLSVGHGRNAILGDTLARLLEATGHEVTREYYFNDAGRQMRVLGESTRARYLEILGREFTFPEDGYQGSYITEIARGLKEEHGEGLVDAGTEVFKDAAQKVIFADIDGTLRRIGIRFDAYFNEHTLYEEGKIDAVVTDLRDAGLVYEQDGATWFRTTAFGMDKDRVIIKNTGEPTYRLPDIAYHREKFRRGFDRMINVFGADHIATVPDVLAGVKALGYPADRIEVVLYQFVTLLRGGKQVKMSTRKATFVTVDELVDEVGVDALRFFFLMRKSESQLEFDLDLATRESQENPVYYVQYAHARLCSIVRLAGEEGRQIPGPTSIARARLAEPEEHELLKTMAGYPDMVEGAARDLAPHRVVFYLMELAGQFHRYYNKHKVLTDDGELREARLCLCGAVRQVIANGLRLIGLGTPENM